MVKRNQKKQQRLLRRRQGETCAADPQPIHPEVPSIDSGTFDASTEHLPSVPTLDGGSFDGKSAGATISVPPALTPIATSARAIARGLRGGF
jgi:hypothetical protein